MTAPWFHHVFLHFPIVLFIIGGLFAVFILFKPTPRLHNALLLLFGFGVLLGLAATIAGLLSADHLIEEGVAEARVNGHRNAAIITMVLGAISLVLLSLRGAREKRGAFRIIGLLFAIATAAMVTVTGDRGGRLLHPSLGPFTEVEGHTHETSGEHGVAADHQHEEGEQAHQDTAQKESVHYSTADTAHAEGGNGHAGHEH